jgi:hypothetical protein
LGSDIPLEILFPKEVNLAMQDSFERDSELVDLDQIDWAAVLNEKVDVGLGSRLPSGHRSKNAKRFNPVLSPKVRDFSSMGCKDLANPESDWEGGARSKFRDIPKSRFASWANSDMRLSRVPGIDAAITM